MLSADTSFAKLHAKVVVLSGKSTLDVEAAVLMLAKAKHPAGHAFMVLKRKIAFPAWDAISNVRIRKHWSRALDSVLAVDEDGNFMAKWCPMLPHKQMGYDVAVSLIEGNFDRIDDWYALALPWLGFRNTRAIVNKYPPLCVAKNFWLDAQRMDIAEQPLSIIMAAVGHGQSRSVPGSFREFYELQKMRAKSLDSMPADIAVVVAITASIHAAIRRVFEQFAAFQSNLFLRGLHNMRRRVLIDVHAKSGVMVEIDSIDARIKAAIKDFRAYEEGVAAHQRPHMQPLAVPLAVTGVDARTIPSAALPISQARAVPQLTCAPVALPAAGAPAPTGEYKRFSTKEAAAFARLWPAGIAKGWGDQATRWGIFISDSGPVFGNRLVQFRKTIRFKAGTCIAAAGPNGPGPGNSKWCCNVNECIKLGYAAHEYPEGVTADDISVTLLSSKELADMSKTWKVIVPPVVALQDRKAEAPNPPWKLSCGPARGDEPYVKTKSKLPALTNPPQRKRAGDGDDAGKKKKGFEGHPASKDEPSGAVAN